METCSAGIARVQSLAGGASVALLAGRAQLELSSNKFEAGRDLERASLRGRRLNRIRTRGALALVSRDRPARPANVAAGRRRGPYAPENYTTRPTTSGLLCLRRTDYWSPSRREFARPARPDARPSGPRGRPKLSRGDESAWPSGSRPRWRRDPPAAPSALDRPPHPTGIHAVGRPGRILNPRGGVAPTSPPFKRRL